MPISARQIALSGAAVLLLLSQSAMATKYAPTRSDTLIFVQPPPAESVPSIDVFVPALAPYGMWLKDKRYGQVWAPFQRDYRPYTHGTWQVTSYGLTWMSNEPFAWAVFHYGVWVWRNERWLWKPDTKWAPAWVSWRETEGYFGWAPMPPDPTVNVVEERWQFVAGKDLLRPDLRKAVAAADQHKAYAHSWPVTREARIAKGDRFPAGPDPAQLRSFYGVSVRPQPFSPSAVGRFPGEAWRDPGALERIRFMEQVQRRSGKHRSSR